MNDNDYVTVKEIAQDVLINHEYDFNCIMCRVKYRTLDVFKTQSLKGYCCFSRHHNKLSFSFCANKDRFTLILMPRGALWMLQLHGQRNLLGLVLLLRLHFPQHLIFWSVLKHQLSSHSFRLYFH